jgi:hypothetical protein
MAHLGSLGTQSVSGNVHDIRGTIVRGSDGAELGKVDDVIFDHDTMEIRYLVVDGAGWLEAETFLLPADIVFTDENHEDGLATGVTKEQIENSPQYNRRASRSGDNWDKYLRQFKKYWEEDPIIHMKDSYRIVTPPPSDVPESTVPNSASQGKNCGVKPVNLTKLFPDMLTPVFTDPAPGGGKVTLRPKSAARAEESASGAALMKPYWWESFENYLRGNKDDIQFKCPRCPSKAA